MRLFQYNLISIFPRRYLKDNCKLKQVTEKLKHRIICEREPRIITGLYHDYNSHLFRNGWKKVFKFVCRKTQGIINDGGLRLFIFVRI